MLLKIVQKVLFVSAVFLLIVSVVGFQKPVAAVLTTESQSVELENIIPNSIIHSMQVGFAAENGKTTIWLRICSDAPHFQMRSESIGQWTSELFLRTGSSGGCSPSASGWWRLVVNANANTGEVFRIYGSAQDHVLSEGEFMARAARTECRVTGLGAGTCSPGNPAPVSVPRSHVDEPAHNQTVQGVTAIRGWAVDAGSWNGPGVTDVHVRVNGTFIGAASYGEHRSDIGNSLGDPRYNNSGYSINFDANQFPQGAATIQVTYRSALTGSWHAYDRQINIGVSNQPPNPPNLISPFNGSILSYKNVTLTLQDTGDPDNGPRNYRDFFYVIERTDGSWSQSSGWIGASWTVTIPGGGDYRWRAQSGDGAAASAWSPWATFKSSLAGPVPPPPPPPVQPGLWDVPYFWQGDPRWGYNKIGACNNNIRNVGCALTSLSMLFQFYGVNHNPGTLNSCMGGQACPLYWGGSTVRGCSNGRVRFLAWTGFSYPRLDQELDKGPVILELKHPSGGTHFIVVLGGSGSSPANYVVNDPGFKSGARRKLSESMAVFKGYQPSSMRIYSGTRASARTIAEFENNNTLISSISPQPTGTDVVSGSLVLYSYTETEIFLELAAQSSAGTVTDMKIWTDQDANDVWQPFAEYVSVPVHTTFYVQFRDDQGNISNVISASIPNAPDDVQAPYFALHLPLIRR